MSAGPNRAERRRAARAAKARIEYASPAIAAASRGDAAWFEQHPRRSHRLRPALPGEGPDITAKTAEGMWIIVRQVQPGFRIRLACWPHPTPPPDDEDFAHVVFDAIAEHEATGRFVSRKEIGQRIMAMARSGHA